MSKKWWLYAIIAVIFGWGLVLRCYDLSQASYWMDEAYSITLAQAVVQHGYPLLDSGQTIWRDPVYHYLLAGITVIAGISEVATRILSVLAGMSSVGLLGYIAYRWFGIKVSLVLLGLMSLSYWEIAWSRQARMYMIFQMLCWVTLFLIERVSTKVQPPALRRWVGLVVGIGLSIVATIFTHRLGIIVIGLAVIFLVSKKFTKNIFVCSSLMIGVVFFSAIMSRLFYGHWVNYWLHYWQYLVLHYPVTLGLAALGLIVLLYKQHRLAWWLVSMFITYIGILSYAVPLVQYRYLFVVWPIVLLWAAYSIVWLIQQWKYSTIIIVLALVFSHEYILWPKATIILESDAPTSALPYKSFTPQPDFRAAYVEMKKNGFMHTVTPYPVITRLYSDQDDIVAIPLDLTGTTLPKTKNEIYTGVPYITLDQLKFLHINGPHGIILVDTFSRHRIEPVIRGYIEDNLALWYTYDVGVWSKIQLYKY